MAKLFQNAYTPDVLTCLANLSNDEVFTPPEVANQMLDLLPKELWKDSTATFLDPCCKSGVFLREIAARLIEGLAEEFPDLQQRVDHIFQKQLFGIAITELTSLLSRRSVYCSKYPNSRFSISQFDTPEGNIRYRITPHQWQGERCVYCGASKAEYARGTEMETHAYQWIHTLKPEEIFNMKFDVIIGNPPYQLSDGGGMGSSALPIYNKFVQQSKKLNPRYLVMIIPSRWFSGGRGLDSFRESMLVDNRTQVIHDFLDASDVFPGVEIKGGVCYFLWNRNYNGICEIHSHAKEKVIVSKRPLLEENMDTFIRRNELIGIFRKVVSCQEESFSTLISANDPFGFDVREANSYRRIKPVYSLEKKSGMIPFYYNGWRNKGVGYIEKESLRKGVNLIGVPKIFIAKAWGTGNAEMDWLTPLMVGDDACCTETYLVVGPFKNQEQMRNAASYIGTRFFHAMISLVKITQNTMQRAYRFVPMQDFSKPWTDAELYEKYKLTEDEISFIESMIKPMDGGEIRGK